MGFQLNAPAYRPSLFNSRAIKSASWLRGSRPSNNTPCRLSHIGMLIPFPRARRTTLSHVGTPPPPPPCSPAPPPVFRPCQSARQSSDSAPPADARGHQVPIPASPANVSACAPKATPSRVISTSPRVSSAALALFPARMPSNIPAAIAITFFSAPPVQPQQILIAIHPQIRSRKQLLHHRTNFSPFSF